MTDEQRYQEVVRANILLHTQLSDHYSTCEPHFRAENVAHVERKLNRVLDRAGRQRLLDLGCGTGFIIQIAKRLVPEIHGVDVTQAMLDKVDTSGGGQVVLHNCDSGAFPAEDGRFDVVTSYSFLHHLYDIVPTLKTAWRALKPGGCYYVDLDPNFYFWNAIGQLDRRSEYDPIVKREIEMVTYKDEDLEKQFGVDKEVFNKAEYGKSFLGGFSEESLREKLSSVGFSSVEFNYEWFVGQGALINDGAISQDQRFEYAAQIDALLQRAMPLSRQLFKYIGFVAVK